jgi:2-polyprenyl-3-methyl-5-hydroxy-6-metoxy-1,4-benzoquinol methylase
MRTQRHKYEYKVSPHSAAAKVVRMVGSDKRVLELGPGPGAITRLLKENACRITALELDPKAIELVAQYCDHVHPCNLNDSGWSAPLLDVERFQAIVAGDVFEHLYDPWSVLNQLPPLLSDAGCVVISLPHAAHNAVVSCLLAENFEYQPWGLLDKTHIRFFGIKNIQRLFNDAGLKIVEADFVVKTPEQTEFARNWRKLSAETRAALSLNPFGTVYQVVVKAVPRDAPGKALRLMSLTVPPPSSTSFSAGGRGNLAYGFMLSFLSLRSREMVFRLLKLIGIRL